MQRATGHEWACSRALHRLFTDTKAVGAHTEVPRGHVQEQAVHSSDTHTAAPPVAEGGDAIGWSETHYRLRAMVTHEVVRAPIPHMNQPSALARPHSPGC